MSPTARSRRAGWLLLASLAGLGGSSPDVVRVRVPDSKVAAWFPVGSELRSLPIAEFEELVRAAGDRPDRARGPRILKARHSARWDEGALIGRSELTIGPDGGDPTPWVVLDPWSPALPATGDGSRSARATADGRLALRVDPKGPRSVALDWRLRARPGSDGKEFALSLPDLDIASLSLDLPAHLVPDGAGPATVGPGPSPGPGRSSWRFEAARGRIDLRLFDPSEVDDRARAARLWLGGTTRIDLNASTANWKAEWTLDESPGAPRLVVVELDPGLDPIDVSGPRVASFRVEPGGPATRITIRIEGAASGPSPVTIRAICRPPADGPWPIPSARPVDATWIGGRTTVRVDPTRVLRSCVDRSGRRVPPRPGEPADTMVFEPTGPGPVAELTFRRPTADATVEVRGHLRLGDDVPRLDAALTWTVDRGSVLAHAADLPPGWTPDRVVSAAGEAVAWHADPLSNGGTRVHMQPPPPDDESRSLTLTVGASARQSGPTGPLDLPRVRPAPSGGRVVDEVWVGTTDPSLSIRPILGRGLAWIDPPTPGPEGGEAPWKEADLRGALAWRWLVDDAEARADRTRARADPRGDVRLDATIEGGQLRLEWTLTVEAPDEAIRSIPIHLDGPAGAPPRWRPVESGAPDVTALSLDDARRPGLGFPAGGTAWSLELPGPTRGPIVLRARLDRPWTGSGSIPLLILPGRFHARGLVAIEVEDTARIRVEADGLTAIDLSETSAAGSIPAGSPPREGAGRRRRAATYLYRGAGGRIRAETTPGVPDPIGGLIREAILTTQAFPGVGLRHRLTLRIAAGSARTIGLTMPGGAEVDRIRREGQTVDAVPSGAPIRVAIPPQTPARSDCTITLDYRTGGPGTGRIRPGDLLPSCSMPCLSFVWEVLAPEPWRVDDPTPGLVATDPRPASAWPERLLGVRPSTWSRPDRRHSEAEAEAMLAQLDRAPADLTPGETRLGDWLLRLDAGRWPIVVDRLAMQSAGWGPAGRINLAAAGTGPIRSPSVILQAMGLAAVPYEAGILITTRAESPARPVEDRPRAGSRDFALREATSDGADPSDRFQSAARWRDEPTPRTASGGETADRTTGMVGWRNWRFVATGWPAPGDSAGLVDDRSEAGWGWLVGSAVLLAGIWSRRMPAPVRSIGLGSALVAAAVGLAWGWPDPSATAIGLTRGSLAVLAFWIGRSFRRPPARGPRPGRAGDRVSTGSLALAAVAIASMPSAAGPAADAPILAVLPFEGLADPSSRPDRAVMLASDHDRLTKIARPDRPTGAPAGVWLVAASQIVGREGPGLAVVESRYEVEVVGAGPASWDMPVGTALDLSATVDDRPTPLAIARDGLAATASIGGPGVHSIRFRRSVPLVPVGAGGERLRLPVNRAAFAQVAVSQGPEARWVEVPDAAGLVRAGPDGVGGELGPVDAIEVRWYPRDRPPTSALRGPVREVALWDARPVGDLIRLRLAHSDPDGAPTIRIGMEPGLLVRVGSIPGLIGSHRGGTADRPEWVARFDPPLPRDVPIEVEFWRPVAAGQVERRWPRIEVLGAERCSGEIGFRRPGDWSGRLEAGGGAEPHAEANFVRTWGALPEDGFTLAGAVRFDRAAEIGVAIAPVPLRRVVQSRVGVDLEAGRLVASIEAVLSDRRGRSFDIELGIPTDFRVIRVQSGGLVDWQPVGRDRLRLQFDGSEVAGRKIRVVGSVPAPADPVMTESRDYRARIPWPRWLAAEAEPGVLVIAGPGRFQMEPGAGVAPMSPAGPAPPDPAYRTTYRVNRPEGIGPVLWSSPRSRVGVTVQSDLTIDPTDVHWTAVIRSEVTGGPADSLQWTLPAVWAKGASLEIEGHSHRLIAEPRGEEGETTLWKVFPDPPIWGRARIVLRSRVPLQAGEIFSYPEISPLAPPGRGAVERYELAIANVSGRPMEVSGTAGLQAIDAAQFRPDESPAPPGSIDRAYRVTGDRPSVPGREDWSLQVRVGREDGAGRRPRPDSSAGVDQAQLTSVFGPLGYAWGRAQYDLSPGPGPFLGLRLPAGAHLPWAAVDGSTVPALADGPGRWLIPLGGRDARRVDLAWLAPASGSGAGRPAPVAWPELDRADVPSLYRVVSHPSVDIEPPDGPGRLSASWWEVEIADQIARRLVVSLSDFDRSSSRGRDEAIRDLVAFELRDRALSRLGPGSKSEAESVAARLATARASIVEACQVAGLEELIQEARARVGVAPAPADPPADPPGDRDNLPRIRRVGRSHFARGVGPGRGRPPSFRWSTRPAPSPRDRAEVWAIGLIGSIASVVVARAIWRRARPSRRMTLTGLAAVSVLLFAWEPVGLAAAIGLVGLGWKVG